MSILGNNSIAWANVQISGGWSRIAWIAGVLAIGLPLMLFGSMRISEDPQGTLSGWFIALGVVQGVLFGIVIPSRVHGAIKRDRLNKLIESHRLMPESAPAAVLGYIFGPNILLLSCMGVVMIVGLFIASAAKQDPAGWLSLHAAGGGLSLLVCCLVAFTTQYLPKFNPAMFGFIFGPLAVNVGTIVPALRVMFSPYTWGFMSLKQGDIELVHIIAFASHMALAGILFIGACRRYRRDDVMPLGFGWGTALLGLWVVLTCIGAMGERVSIIGPFNTDQVVGMSYVVGLSLAMLISVGPLTSAATAIAEWRARRAIDPYFVQKKPLLLPIAAVIILALLLSLLAAAPPEVGVLTGFSSSPRFRDNNHLILTGLVIGIFVISVTLIARDANRAKVGPLWLILPWIGLCWLLLPFIDAMTALMQGQIEQFPRGLSSASPPFCLGLIWKDKLATGLIGIVAQIATIPLILLLLQGVLKVRKRASNADLNQA